MLGFLVGAASLLAEIGSFRGLGIVIGVCLASVFALPLRLIKTAAGYRLQHCLCGDHAVTG